MTTNRANAAEDELVRRQEAERRREDAWESLQQGTRANRAEHARLRALHLRPCPKCGTALEPRTLRGVEVDQCNTCRGTWLDEGELERLTQSVPGLVARLLATIRGAAEQKRPPTK